MIKLHSDVLKTLPLYHGSHRCKSNDPSLLLSALELSFDLGIFQSNMFLKKIRLIAQSQIVHFFNISVLTFWKIPNHSFCRGAGLFPNWLGQAPVVAKIRSLFSHSAFGIDLCDFILFEDIVLTLVWITQLLNIGESP